MRHYYLLLLYVLLTGASARAQTAATPPPSSQLLLKVAPLSVLDLRTSVLQFGLEYRPIPRVGVSLDYGPRLSILRKKYSAEDDVRYFRLRSEVRYYFALDERLAWFPAVEGFYVPWAKNTGPSSYYRDGALFSYDRARLRKQAWGVCVKYGLMLRLGSRWWLEGATGIGIRWVTSSYHGVENEQPVAPADADRYERGWGFVPGNPDPGREAKPHIALNLKFGYTLLSR